MVVIFIIFVAYKLRNALHTRIPTGPAVLYVNPGEKGAGGLGGARDKGLRGPRSRGRRW